MDKDLDNALDEFADATYCSYGSDYIQNEAAKKRAIEARKLIKGLLVKARIDEISNVIGKFEVRVENSDSLYFYSKHERIENLEASLLKDSR